MPLRGQKSFIYIFIYLENILYIYLLNILYIFIKAFFVVAVTRISLQFLRLGVFVFFGYFNVLICELSTRISCQNKVSYDRAFRLQVLKAFPEEANSDRRFGNKISSTSGMSEAFCPHNRATQHVPR